MLHIAQVGQYTLPEMLGTNVVDFQDKMTPLEVLCSSFYAALDTETALTGQLNHSNDSFSISNNISNQICSWVCE